MFDIRSNFSFEFITSAFNFLVEQIYDLCNVGIIQNNTVGVNVINYVNGVFV